MRLNNINVQSQYLTYIGKEVPTRSTYDDFPNYKDLIQFGTNNFGILSFIKCKVLLNYQFVTKQLSTVILPKVIPYNYLIVSV